MVRSNNLISFTKQVSQRAIMRENVSFDFRRTLSSRVRVESRSFIVGSAKIRVPLFLVNRCRVAGRN